ncbi:MAG: MFS transporter [Halosimplex sp.]
MRDDPAGTTADSAADGGQREAPPAAGPSVDPETADPETPDPETGLTAAETDLGLRNITRMGLTGQAMGTLTGGAFMTAVLVQLGSPLYVFGLLSALPALAGAVQVPAAYVIEKYRARKRIAFFGFVATRVFVLSLAAIPLLFGGQLAITLLLAAILLQNVASAVSGPAWNSITRDLVPDERMGAFFSRRQKLTVGVSIPLSLGAGWFVTWWAKTNPGSLLRGYSLLFFAGFAVGMGSLYFVRRTPEPAMAPAAGATKFTELVLVPFRDENFRNLMQFLGAWGFAMAIASPFFTVYLLQRLGFEMSFVIALTVVSQLANVVFVQIWGRLADRFSNKAVLGVSGPLVLGSTILWLFTAMPDPHRFTVPLIVLIHVLRGMSMAGVSLTTGNIAMRLAPQGQGTSYLAANSLVGALAGGIAPLVGGAVAGAFELHRFTITLNWESPGGVYSLSAFYLQGMDFAFVLAFLVGIYAMHRLSLVVEAEAVQRSVVVRNLVEEIKRPLVTFTAVDGALDLLTFPFDALRQTRQQIGERRNGRRRND